MTFAEWLSAKCAAHDMPLYRQAPALGYSTTTLCRWRQGVITPTAVELADLLAFYGPLPDGVAVTPREPNAGWVRAKQDRERVMALVFDGMTLTEAAAKVGRPRGIVNKWWRANLLASGATTGSKDGWTKAQKAHLIRWVGEGREWRWIAQCLGRTVEQCESCYGQFSLKVGAPGADDKGDEEAA